jgi:hypothetical protein
MLCCTVLPLWWLIASALPSKSAHSASVTQGRILSEEGEESWLPPSQPPPFRVLALWGSSDDPDLGVCITSPTETRAPDGTKIAAQCCTASGACKRRTANRNAACIAGVFGESSFVEMTYAQTETACTSRGLVMCERSCAGEGCGYNDAYVWTGLACPPSPPLPPSPSLPLPPTPPLDCSDRSVVNIDLSSSTNPSIAMEWTDATGTVYTGLSMIPPLSTDTSGGAFPGGSVRFRNIGEVDEQTFDLFITVSETPSVYSEMVDDNKHFTGSLHQLWLHLPWLWIAQVVLLLRRRA